MAPFAGFEAMKLERYFKTFVKGATLVWREPYQEEGEEIWIDWTKGPSAKNSIPYQETGVRVPEGWVENVMPSDIVLSRWHCLTDGVRSYTSMSSRPNAPLLPETDQKWEVIGPQVLRIVSIAATGAPDPVEMQAIDNNPEKSFTHTSASGQMWYCCRTSFRHSEQLKGAHLESPPSDWINKSITLIRSHAPRPPESNFDQATLLSQDWRVLRGNCEIDTTTLAKGDNIVSFRRIYVLGGGWQFCVTELPPPMPQAVWDKWFHNGSPKPPRSIQEWLADPLGPDWKQPTIEDYLIDIRAELETHSTIPIYQTTYDSEGLRSSTTLHPLAFARDRAKWYLEEMVRELEEKQTNESEYGPYRKGAGKMLALLLELRNFDRILATPSSSQGRTMDPVQAAKHRRNRFPNKHLYAWLESVIQKMPANQRKTGMVLLALAKGLQAMNDGQPCEGWEKIGGEADSHISHDDDKGSRLSWKRLRNWLSPSGILGKWMLPRGPNDTKK